TSTPVVSVSRPRSGPAVQGVVVMVHLVRVARRRRSSRRPPPVVPATTVTLPAPTHTAVGPAARREAGPVSNEVEIGRGKRGRRAFSFDDVAVVPSRRTRAPEEVSVGWQIDAYHFGLPILAAPMDSVMSPATAV